MRSLIRLTMLSGAGALAAMLTGSAARADVTISSAATSNMSCVSGICTPTAKNAVLNVGDLTTMLASGNVKLAAAGEPVDVDIAAPLSWVSTNTLTLDSYHSINVQQPVAITGGGGLAIITNDGGTGGEFAFAPATNVTIWSLASSLSINGTAYTLVDDIATLASDVTANPSGSYALAGNYNAAPDGSYSKAPVSTNFAGSFQGLGNTISNLTISNGARNARLGLFAFAETGANISNVTLQNVVVKESVNGSTLSSLVGINEGALFGNHSSGVISGQLSSAVGGLVGVNYGVVLNSSSSAGLKSGKASAIGGLAGVNDGSFIDGGGVISDCFATGQVSGTKSKVELGGLVGSDNGGTILNSYATGSARENGKSQLGGLAGTEDASTISTSYSTGAVRGSDSGFVGGFIGIAAMGTFLDDYWNVTTSGTEKASGNNPNLPDITGETSKKLRAGLPTGFDPTIWAQSPSINNGFPYLINNPPQ